MTTTELQCPKCRSTQLTANKKGFSGKQAVGGAILTGGIGLLAGTIGSNAIKITCLSCGNQFKPGEDLEGLKRKKQEQLRHIKNQNKAMKNPITWVLIIVAVSLWLGFLSLIGFL